jgi:hypothetical protein
VAALRREKGEIVIFAGPGIMTGDIIAQRQSTILSAARTAS